MASEEQRLSFQRKAQGRANIPIPPFPKYPQFLKDRSPLHQQALGQHEEEIEKWRRTLGGGVEQFISTTIVSGPGPTPTRGPQGFQGTPGVQGPQGSSTGTQGPQGVQGGQGLQGHQGLGHQGFQGNQGEEGVQGLQGRQGRQGTQGAGFQGAQGYQGTQGAGNQGAQGVQGAPGTQGAQGTQGTQGAGSQGNQGTPGAQGNQGFQGVQGAGAQGAQGSQGLQGFQGVQGAGMQGSQGFQGNVGQVGGFTLEYRYETTATAPPANGEIRFNNANPVLATKVFVSKQDVHGHDVSAFLATLGIDDEAKVFAVVNSAQLIIVMFTNVADQTGYVEFDVAVEVNGLAGDPLIDGVTVGLSPIRKATTGSQGAQGFQGRQGFQGLQGSQGNIGSQGFQGLDGQSGFGYFYQYAVDDNPPGSTHLSLNAGLTELRIDVDNYHGASMQALHLSMGVGDKFQIFKRNEPENFAIFSVTSVSNQGDHVLFGITPIEIQAIWVREDLLFVSPSFKGTAGPQGAQGIQGFQGRQGFQGVQGAGAQGAQGAGGAQGFQGVQGAGTQGVDGESGFGYFYRFKDADNPPGEGNVSYQDNFNGTATLRLDADSFDGQPLQTWHFSIGPGNKFMLSKRHEPNNFVILTVISGASGGDHVVFTCTITEDQAAWVRDDILFVSPTFIGPQGSQGSQGAQGAQGNQGFQGRQGFQGVIGAQGLQGVIGAQGAQGFQGVIGAQGFQGLQGSQGNQGFQGRQGFQGLIGLQGAQGFQGRQGFQGVPGTGVEGGVSAIVVVTAGSYEVNDPFLRATDLNYAETVEDTVTVSTSTFSLVAGTYMFAVAAYQSKGFDEGAPSGGLGLIANEGHAFRLYNVTDAAAVVITGAGLTAWGIAFGALELAVTTEFAIDSQQKFNEGSTNAGNPIATTNLSPQYVALFLALKIS